MHFMQCGVPGPAAERSSSCSSASSCPEAARLTRHTDNVQNSHSEDVWVAHCESRSHALTGPSWSGTEEPRFFAHDTFEEEPLETSLFEGEDVGSHGDSPEHRLRIWRGKSAVTATHSGPWTTSLVVRIVLDFFLDSWISSQAEVTDPGCQSFDLGSELVADVQTLVSPLSGICTNWF